MFTSISHKRSHAGTVASIVINLSLLALVIGLSAAVHKVEKAHLSETLIFPQEIPPPQPLIVKMRPTVTHNTGHRFGTPALVRAGAPVISPVRHEAAQPMLVEMDMPEHMELPQTNTHTVAMAPVARLTGFGGSTTVGSPGPSGTAVNGGFGIVSGSGSGRGTGRIIRTDFAATPTAFPAPAVVVKPVTSSAVVWSIPRAHYTDAARAAHVTGDVVLRVRFTASGTVEVLEVVQSPGFGLDRVARVVAAGIEFKPAVKDGMPVDSIHTVTVQFQIG
jgi:TonB family protein